MALTGHRHCDNTEPRSRAAGATGKLVLTQHHRHRRCRAGLRRGPTYTGTSACAPAGPGPCRSGMGTNQLAIVVIKQGVNPDRSRQKRRTGSLSRAPLARADGDHGTYTAIWTLRWCPTGKRAGR